MIDDFRPVAGRKPKVIEPLARQERAPLPNLGDDFVIEPTSSDIAAPDESEQPETVTEQSEESTVTEDGSINEQSDGEDEKAAAAAAATITHDSGVTTGKKNHKRRRLHWPPTKKEAIIGGAVLLVLVGGITGLVLAHHSKSKTVAAVIHVNKPKPVVPTTVASTLSGLQVNPAVNKLPVTAVMIENSDEARPQSGLGSASVVFEAVAEGGITRFMALYQDTSPSNVGPIRSARPYYVEWELGFNAGYAHVGGSPDALTDIKNWNVRDLDEFYNGDSYHRITSREAPHNVYTAISTLNQLEDSKGYTSSTYTGFPRKVAAPAKNPTATTISMTLSGPDYNPQYVYNAATNSYNRSEGGAAQMDANTNTQISPTVVIGIVVPESQGALDASDAYYSNYNVLGTGTAYVFQDGTEITGQWTKSSDTSQITFTTTGGATLKLDPGQTWLTAITSSSDITYN
jgi:hypothetical protein